LGWAELEAKAAAPATDEQAVKDKEALKKAAIHAFSGANQRPLVRLLLNYVRSVSYRSTRSEAEIAYHEGVRALALSLLQLGEVKDD
jgi:hypothetical protein